MSATITKFVYWTPRVLCLLFIPFIMMFSLDVFDHAKTAREIAIGLLMHNIPALVLGVVLWAAWRREWIGAIVFGALGVFYIWWAWERLHWTACAFIAGPLFVMSALFLIGWIYRNEIRLPKPGQILVSFALVSLLTLGTGCATFRSELGNKYQGEARRNDGKPVSVTFVFSHVHQMIGLDAIPKLDNRHQRLNGFDDIFLDAQRELTNLGRYATYTEESSDVNDPDRRAKKDSLIAANDYTVKIRIESKKKFSNYFLGTIGSVLTATIAPIPYYQYYRVTADLFNHDGKLVASYNREAKLAKWVEALLIVAYPFYPEERMREEIYMDFLHDILRQIEAEGVLK